MSNTNVSWAGLSWVRVVVIVFVVVVFLLLSFCCVFNMKISVNAAAVAFVAVVIINSPVSCKMAVVDFSIAYSYTDKPNYLF